MKVCENCGKTKLNRDVPMVVTCICGEVIDTRKPKNKWLIIAGLIGILGVSNGCMSTIDSHNLEKQMISCKMMCESNSVTSYKYCKCKETIIYE